MLNQINDCGSCHAGQVLVNEGLDAVGEHWQEYEDCQVCKVNAALIQADNRTILPRPL